MSNYVYRLYINNKKVFASDDFDKLLNELDTYILKGKTKGTYIVIEHDIQKNMDTPIYLGFGDEESYIQFRNGNTRYNPKRRNKCIKQQ